MYSLSACSSFSILSQHERTGTPRQCRWQNIPLLLHLRESILRGVDLLLVLLELVEFATELILQAGFSNNERWASREREGSEVDVTRWEGRNREGRNREASCRKRRTFQFEWLPCAQTQTKVHYSYTLSLWLHLRVSGVSKGHKCA